MHVGATSQAVFGAIAVALKVFYLAGSLSGRFAPPDTSNFDAAWSRFGRMGLSNTRAMTTSIQNRPTV
jgi:hypothetical protein